MQVGGGLQGEIGKRWLVKGVGGGRDRDTQGSGAAQQCEPRSRAKASLVYVGSESFRRAVGEGWGKPSLEK